MPDALASTRIEPATLDDLSSLTELLSVLFEEGEDFTPDTIKQQHGLRLILEQPNRGRIFVARSDHKIVGMVNILFSISTAEGGLVILLEDLVIHPEHRGEGFGTRLVEHVIDFAKAKDFKRITLLTDKIGEDAQKFFKRHGFNHSKMIPMRLNFAQDEP